MEKRDWKENTGEENLEILQEEETDHLLQSEAMRQRLLEAKQGTEGIPWEEVRRRLGI